MFNKNKKLPFIYWPGVFFKVIPIWFVILIAFGISHGEEKIRPFEILFYIYIGIGLLLYAVRFLNTLVWSRKENPKEFGYYMIAIAAVLIMFGITFYFMFK